MACICGVERILSVSAKSGDCTSVTFKEIEHIGYVPKGVGIGSGDYIEFSYCGGCGQIQNFKPLADKDITSAILGDKFEESFSNIFESEQDA